MLAKLYDETKAVIKIVKQLMIEVMNKQHTIILKERKHLYEEFSNTARYLRMAPLKYGVKSEIF